MLFKTNSTSISILAEYGFVTDPNSTMGIAARGYDLYIKKDGEWLYAASKTNSRKKCEDGEVLLLIKDMDRNEKECMLYLPIHSELNSLKIGVEEGSTLEALESPFRHRIGIFGSSFTHGISTSRPGMSYPMQLMRSTGLQFLSIACSGNCKMMILSGNGLGKLYSLQRFFSITLKIHHIHSFLNFHYTGKGLF